MYASLHWIEALGVTPEPTLASRAWFLFGQIAIGGAVFVAVSRRSASRNSILPGRRSLRSLRKTLSHRPRTARPRSHDSRSADAAGLRLSIVLPAYNEATSIEKNVLEVVATFWDLNYDFEVIVVDDGSPDKTYLSAVRAKTSHPEIVRVVRYDEIAGRETR